MTNNMYKYIPFKIPPDSLVEFVFQLKKRIYSW